MIQLPEVPLPATAQTILADLQKTVDAESAYADKVARGMQLFETKRRSAGFRPILTALKQMCSGPQRCCYCEDSQATDVEHIWPKDFYPELVFGWENYLLACTRCNRPKFNICDIYLQSNGTRLKVPAYVKQHKRHPPVGDPVLINPRREDPLEFMMLDLSDTFFFLPHPRQDPRGQERADYTIRLLRLNEEDVLPKARAEAYGAYRDRLQRYVNHKQRNEPLEVLQHTLSSLKEMRHPTVWHEIKRQRTLRPHQEINELFLAAPEALTW